MNFMYLEGLESYLQAVADFDTDANLKVALMSNAYTGANTDSDWASISANQLGTSQSLGSKSSAGGTATGGSVTFTGIASSLTVKSVVLYRDTGGGHGTLIGYWDTGTNFPLTTSGANITVNWNNTSSTGLMFTL